MKNITPQTYRQVANKIMEAIGENNHFAICNVQDTMADGTKWVFAGTLVIYEKKNNIVPIWYEFNTYDTEGNKIDNDFVFYEMPLLNNRAMLDTMKQL